ncbi:MAG: gliding motility-associated C-terminal domain-containing protein [Salibacteraceae bacterium]
MKIKLVVFIISFLAIAKTNQGAVLPPELRCVSVNVAGNTTITWIPTTDPLNEFIEYQVFISDNVAGPYTMTVVNNINSNSFLDNVNNANLGDYYYFVQSVYNDGSGVTNSPSSDTGQTILPVFGPVTDSTAVVNWNPVFDPDLVSSSGVYNVYRKIGSTNPFVNIGTRNYGNEQLADDFKVCFDTVYYRIEIADNLGCVSQSSILFEEFEDATPPATPVFDSITVIDNMGNQQVQLGWSPSTSLDTRGYYVLYWTKTPPSFGFRDTIFGINNTQFLETLPIIDPNLNWEMYTISAFDSCSSVSKPNGNVSPGADKQRTIHLDIFPNNCENTITLNWSSYINWPDLEGYEILVSINNNPYQSVITLPATDTSFTHPKTDVLAKYCYKIRAFSSGKVRTSTSNFKCAIANSAIIPQKQYFKKVTVQDNKNIFVESLTDTSLPVSQYVLFRSLDKKINFFEVDRIPFENTPVIQFHDYDVSVDQTSYFYRVGVEDTCGSLLFISQPAASIFLEGVWDEDSLNVFLNWNHYKGWDTVTSGVDEYAINLIIDGIKSEIGSVSDSINSFVYPLEDKISYGANFCFEIEAREGAGNQFGQRDTVQSNQICFTDNLKIFVPNAFRPNGENPVFNPVISFGEISSYKLSIYDKWGGIVFETTDYFQGWDGDISGSKAPFGAYVYYLEVENFTGAIYKKRGTFLLLR